MLGGGNQLLLARIRKRVFGEKSTPPQRDIPSPSASLPQTPPRGSFDLKPGRKTVTHHFDQRDLGGQREAPKGEGLKERSDLGEARGRGANPSSNHPDDRHLPRHPPNSLKAPSSSSSSAFSEAQAGATGFGRLTAAAAPEWPPPPSGSADTAAAATAAAAAPVTGALRPFFPASSARPVPLRGGLFPPLPLFPLFHHSYRPETLLPLLLLFIISG